MATLWLHYDYVMAAAMATASARRKAVLRPRCQPGEKKCVCSSYGSSCLLPASSRAKRLNPGFSEPLSLGLVSKSSLLALHARSLFWKRS